MVDDTEVAARLGLVLKRAEQALIARKNAALREYGLTVPQYAVLLHLASTPGQSGAQLARRSQVTAQTMATVLANLAAKGLIDRKPSAVHGKVLVATLTPTGKSLLRKADRRAAAIERDLAAAYTDTERAALTEYLNRAIALLSK